jgi:uncharacterized protein DUF5916
LQGLTSIKPKRNYAITPYTVGKAEGYEMEEGNPFATGKSKKLTGGIDGKISLTSDLTLDFTINPDFGQVEADPSEVNLSAFETFFQEKRPFFIEGRNILNFQIMGGDGTFSSDNLFYSRRIGRRPHHSPDTVDDEYANVPVNTSILGAVKITGKTKKGLSIGILDSLTSRESADIDFLGQRRNEAVEPMTNYFVMRLQQDYNGGNTVLGGMLTTTHRNLKDDSLNFLHKSAYTGGLDFYHSWKNKTYFFSLNTVFSHVRGNKDAIMETQESPVHYFQRPDATHLNLDPNRTSLTGHGGKLGFGKTGKGHFRFSGGVTWRSPGLELNDVGYLYTSDVIMQWSWVGYRVWKPFWIFRRINLNFNQWKGWDFSGLKMFGGGNINWHGQLKNCWGIGGGINLQESAVSTSRLRGGPGLKWPGGKGFWANINSDNRKPIRFNVGTFYMKRGDASESSEVWSGVTYRPASAISISLSPFMSWNKNALQYVDTIETDTIKDPRYIMASINQKTMGVSIRLNYSITPELSVQFYGQPFISAGKYNDFKYITDPRADAFSNRYNGYNNQQIQYDGENELYSVDEMGDGNVDYSFDNPNFSFLQFRSNLVVRWEYFPGSTVFLVWSQGRTREDQSGDFRFGRDMRDLFRVQPHNVFLVKFTYRFDL